MAWKLLEKTSEAPGLLDWLGWQLGRETTDRLFYSFYHLKVAENTNNMVMGRGQEPLIPAALNGK